jgi:hypothetical protein
VLLQKVPTEESAGQGQKRFMDLGPLFIANAQATELVQPGESSFYYPAPSSQSTAMLSVALGEPRHDVASTQTLADCLGS